MNEAEQKTKVFSAKMAFYGVGLLAVFGFIIVSAWWDLTFGSFDAVAFVADTLILVAIAIGTMVLSSFSSQEYNLNKLNGLYNVSCNDYLLAYQAIEEIKIYFSQYFFWKMERENRENRENHLIVHGIEGINARKIVRYAELPDIAEMKKGKPYVKTLEDGKKVVLPPLCTEEQVEAVEYALKGNVDVKDKNHSDYLFISDSSEVSTSMLDRKAFHERHRKAAMKRAYIMMIIRLVGTSLLFAALVPADEEEVSSKNKWWTFFKRIGVFFTSFISGWLAGSREVVGRAVAVKDKTAVLQEFHDHYAKGTWKPKTIEEIDQEIIEAQENAELTGGTQNA